MLFVDWKTATDFLDQVLPRFVLTLVNGDIVEVTLTIPRSVLEVKGRELELNRIE